LPQVINIDTSKYKWFPGKAVMTGLAQFFTATCAMGWIWSISHGLVLLENSIIYTKIEKIKKEPEPVKQ
jgi:hypothetical protein